MLKNIIRKPIEPIPAGMAKMSVFDFLKVAKPVIEKASAGIQKYEKNTRRDSEYPRWSMINILSIKSSVIPNMIL